MPTGRPRYVIAFLLYLMILQPVRHLEHRGDGVVHVVIFIAREPAAEQHFLIVCGEIGVFFVQRGILFVVYRVVRLAARRELQRIFARYYRRVGNGFFKMLVLDDARIRNVVIGIIDDRIALVIVGIELSVSNRSERYSSSPNL